MSDMMRSSDINAGGVGHALQLAGNALRLTTATPDQVAAAAAFLAKRARFQQPFGMRARPLWRAWMRQGRRSGRRCGGGRPAGTAACLPQTSNLR